MEKQNFTGSLNLAKLVHVKMERKGKTGNMIKGIFIPLELNHIVSGEKGGEFLNVRGQIHTEPDKYSQNGFIAHACPNEIYKNATEEEKEELKKLPILGNIKIWQGVSNDVTNAVNDTVYSETDDLPF